MDSGRLKGTNNLLGSSLTWITTNYAKKYNNQYFFKYKDRMEEQFEVKD